MKVIGLNNTSRYIPHLIETADKFFKDMKPGEWIKINKRYREIFF